MAKEKQTEAEIYRAKRKARIAKASKKNQKQLLSQRSGQIIGRIVAVVVALAIVCVVCSAALSMSGLPQRMIPAFVMEDGTKVSRAEYRFYYMSTLNMVESYASYYGSYGVTYDSELRPEQQPYTGQMVFPDVEGFEPDENSTWGDFMTAYTRSNICSVKAQYAAAKEMGLELSEDETLEINEAITSAGTTADSNNFSLNAYLRRVYGTGVNEKLYRTILTEQALANKVHEAKEEDLDAAYDDDAKIEKAYQDNLSKYGVLSYLSYTVLADLAEGETTPSADAMKAAKATAKTLAAAADADAFLNQVQALGEAAAAADADAEDDATPTDYKASATHNDVTGKQITDEDFKAWAYGDEAAAGKTHVVKSDLGYTVYFLSEAAHKADDVVTYDVRHILVKFPEETAEEAAEPAETETEEAPAEDAEATSDEEAAEAAADEAAEAATDEEAAATDGNTTVDEQAAAEAEAAEEGGLKPVSKLDMSKASDVTVVTTVDKPTNQETFEKAQGILQLYLDGEHTEDAFAALAQEYSEDSNASEGGLYSDTSLGQMVAPFESWATDPARKAGDVGIVETEYGYHVMYFVKLNTTTWADTVREGEVEEQVHAYLEEVNASPAGTIKKEYFMRSLEKSITKKIKKDISNSRNNSVG